MPVFSLPYPPTVNNMFENNSRGRGRRKSDGYVSWISEAGARLTKEKIKKCNGKVYVSISAKAPDKRKRDIDNIIKPILDLLVSYRVIDADDSSCLTGLSIRWDNILMCPGVIVLITEV